jgi:hypothetical protein
MDINQDNQELLHTKPYHTKLAHKNIYSIPWWTLYIGEAFPTQAYYTKCMQAIIQRWLYIMIQMQCQMHEMHKGKLYICYNGAPTHQLKKSNKHQAPPQTSESCLT